jgi:hypothetical protein
MATKKQPCPHCGKKFAVQGYGRHVVKCAELHGVTPGSTVAEKAPPASKGAAVAAASGKPIANSQVIEGLAKLSAVVNLNDMSWDQLYDLGSRVK